VTARRPVLVAVGAAVMLAGSAFLTDPLPSVLGLAERVVGAALAGELLWLGLRGRAVAGASALSWPPMTFLAAAAFAAGAGSQQLVPGAGPAEALAAALALLTVAVVAVAGRSDGTHLALSALVLLAATGLLRVVLSGPASSLEIVLVAGIGAAIAGVVVLLTPQAISDPANDSTARTGRP